MEYLQSIHSAYRGMIMKSRKRKGSNTPICFLDPDCHANGFVRKNVKLNKMLSDFRNMKYLRIGSIFNGDDDRLYRTPDKMLHYFVGKGLILRVEGLIDRGSEFDRNLRITVLMCVTVRSNLSMFVAGAIQAGLKIDSRHLRIFVNNEMTENELKQDTLGILLEQLKQEVLEVKEKHGMMIKFNYDSKDMYSLLFKSRKNIPCLNSIEAEDRYKKIVSRRAIAILRE